MRSVRTGFGVLVASALAAACGSTGAGAGAGAGSEAAESQASAVSEASGNKGYVIFGNFKGANGSQKFDVGIAGARFGGNGYFLGNKVKSSSGCTLYVDLQDPMGGSAGTIAASSASAGTSLSLVPAGASPDVSYSAELPDGGTVLPYPLAAGEVAFAATGGPDVPAFSAKVSTPSDITGFTPPKKINFGDDLPLTWKAETSDAFVVDVYGLDEHDDKGYLLDCPTTDTGSFTVPAAAMALFPDAYRSKPEVNLIRANQKVVTAGTWSVTVSVLSAYVDDAKKKAKGDAG